jgi:hypothetical protein
MKKLKYIFIFCFLVLITENIIARSVTYQRFSDGTLTKKLETQPEILYELTLHFSEQCPIITDNQAKFLIEYGSVIVNKELLIGHGKYSNNLLNFTPQYKITRLVITNSNNDVRRTFSVIGGNTIVSLWFIFGIVCIIFFNFSLYLLKKGNTAAAAVVAASINLLIRNQI